MTKSKSAVIRKADLLHVLDGVPHGIAVLDKQQRLLGLNRFLGALTGYNSEEVQGIYYDYVLRSNLSHKGNPLQNVIETGESITTEGNIINRRRQNIPIRFTISPIKDSSGKLLGVVLTLEDISILEDLGRKILGLSGLEGIIGHSPKMQEIFDLVPVISQTNASALITGETGTGKDLLAYAIHQTSKRSRYPFIKVNCSALPESLLESELFGYKRGAFTGANTDKPGMFRLAHGGTIYLTEIGDLPLPLQAKLLTVLDDKEFFPLGSSKKVKVDARVIASTHRDLKKFIGQGKFREDLFFRLNVLRLHLPPLRSRDGDIRLLIDHLLNVFNSNLKKSIKGLDQKALDVLLNYYYPGNVRELRNIIEYTATVCQENTIRSKHLPKYMFLSKEKEPLSSNQDQESEKNVGTLDINPESPSEASGSMSWVSVEKRMIMEALMKTGGKRGRAAKLLGWGRSTLWRKIKQYELE
ncbi:MAG: sigma 54-interacting transcriptional regulator [Deltaproteobacteria bacterium]|nr:sigma 54-interacting transcriptional regulator [Deltaproteobacteria bacterium]MBW1932630.1 sigma 54-interacting transcriptional regulator [Deltaproteobacteria bacterium]MBW1938744.1 sigma 54-interacting transcriptional regulator [Deltaproteobacteria bacterium]MBW1964818.1 sigma 54-interacting transcriptional regulator [Deltaproteobacteria bacterium]MBW2079774.1 sigma 54-interacting transcriptional regulator [Deltaproteobacteria bacterium]